MKQLRISAQERDENRRRYNQLIDALKEDMVAEGMSETEAEFAARDEALEWTQDGGKF